MCSSIVSVGASAREHDQQRNRQREIEKTSSKQNKSEKKLECKIDSRRGFVVCSFVLIHECGNFIFTIDVFILLLAESACARIYLVCFAYPPNHRATCWRYDTHLSQFRVGGTWITVTYWLLWLSVNFPFLFSSNRFCQITAKLFTNTLQCRRRKFLNKQTNRIFGCESLSFGSQIPRNVCFAFAEMSFFFFTEYLSRQSSCRAWLSVRLTEQS